MKFWFILGFALNMFSQEVEVFSVFFDTDKFEVKANQAQEMITFVNSTDSTQIESIQIYGYCDDRGKENYNLILSENRANAVKQILLDQGIISKIIVTIEGKGRILINEDAEGDVSEMRSKNRRVDVVLEKKPVTIEDLKIPSMYSKLQDNHVVGDRIYLKEVYFEMGSSKLTPKAIKELIRLSAILRKYPQYHFEIQGHICCTPKNVKEAIDNQTKKRELSVNRAKNVHNFLIKKSIKKNRLTYKGLGNTQPLGKDKTYDRRVELLITKIEE